MHPLALRTVPQVPAAADGGSMAAPAAARQRIEQMSGEVVDSNPYSRLMALQRMGIVKNYSEIRDKTVRGAAAAGGGGGRGGFRARWWCWWGWLVLVQWVGG